METLYVFSDESKLCTCRLVVFSDETKLYIIYIIELYMLSDEVKRKAL